MHREKKKNNVLRFIPLHEQIINISCKTKNKTKKLSVPIIIRIVDGSQYF